MAVPPEGANRYQKIPERNLFGLKEIPPDVPPTNKEPPPALPKVFLTGITTLLGNKIAFFSVQFPTKPGQPAKEQQSLTLAEGQRDEGIELLTIDEIGKQVRINNSGTEMTLNFDKDGIKTVGNTTAATAPNPGQPSPTPGMGTTPLPSNPSTAAITPPQAGFRRTLRLPNPSVAPTTQVAPPPSPAALGAPAAAAQQQAAGTSTPVTPEEELLLRALQEKNAGRVSPQ
jgi:hypothetical protein